MTQLQSDGYLHHILRLAETETTKMRAAGSAVVAVVRDLNCNIVADAQPSVAFQYRTPCLFYLILV